MSRVTIKTWYERVAATWPKDVPLPTNEEALRGAAKLWRYAFGKKCRLPIVLTSGNRYTYPQGGEFPVNPDRKEHAGRGWIALVHDFSHYVHRDRNPGIRPHSGAHARIEIAMIKEVLKRGWLSGALKSPIPVAPPPLSKIDASRVKLDRVLAAIVRWDRKKRRAENALKKLLRQRRRLEHSIGEV